jgi:hypothetical protein
MTEYRIFGDPHGQRGLVVQRYQCNDNAPPTAQDWPFSVVGGSPWGEAWQPHGIGWTPTNANQAQGVETFFAAPTRVDVFRIYQTGPAGQDIGFALVDYDPQSSNQTWLGVFDLSTAVAGWGQWDIADRVFTWYRYTNGVYDQTTATGTIAAFTASHGGDAGGARFSFNFGCDGQPFGIDGFEVGSSSTGWNAFNFEGYPSKVGLSTSKSTTDRCAVSVARFPREVRFNGSLSDPGGWRGWQYAGVGGSSRWVPVPKAKGSTANRFSYRAKVAENSWFDAAYGPTATHEYSDSRDIYVPAFPSIELKAASRTVVRGRRLVVSGVIRPARPLSFTVLHAVPQGRQWSQMRKIGSHRADKHGRFRFNVPTGRLGWNSIDILTRSGHDLTTTISRRSVQFRVVKPKAPPPPPDNGPSTTVSTDDDSAAQGDQQDFPTGGTHRGDELRRVVLERPKGYGACGWYLPGRPPGRAVLGRTVAAVPQPVALSSDASTPVAPVPGTAPDRYPSREGVDPPSKLAEGEEAGDASSQGPPTLVMP